jgi:hypothetical protein
MTKGELMEVARKELGMSMSQSAKETVVTLREKIRSQRTVSEMASDFRTTIPKNLNGMIKADLQAEVTLRELPLIPMATRPQMIVQIRDDVNTRRLEAGLDQNSTSSTQDQETSLTGTWTDVAMPQYMAHTPGSRRRL